jgi:nucleotide-binding universal stress UspA family protein
MTIIVGYAPDERGRGALQVAAMLARSTGDELEVCSVVPRPWPSSLARGAHEGADTAEAKTALEHARAKLPGDVTADFQVRLARSGPSGLVEAAKEYDARMIVLGSSSAGVFGHVALGSVTHRLLHSSPTPLAMAPRGFRSRSGGSVRRVTAAYGGSEEADRLAVAAAELAIDFGADLRLATFMVRERPSYVMRLGTDSEDSVLEEWVREMEDALAEAKHEVTELPTVPRSVETAIGHGGNWEEALEAIDWGEGDLLVIGSSAVAPVARVFLGSRAAKIMRHSPVPVVMVPRRRAAELAEQAEHG